MVSRLAFRKAAAAAILFVCSVASAFAQFASDKVSLYVNWEPSHFGATSGNGCWGYVSASGREYALMGLNNQVAFIEITNPASPVWVTSIPHTSSTWGDIKVYGNYAYAVTETSGTGIQVMDMSQIDLGIVTLVRTITSPGRTHTLALDPDSKYLYTCGSRDGTGTTMCFSLANPANPVKVGPATMTTNYMHEATVITYTSGPAAGKQIFYGFSEGRGVDVYDMTNKNAPVLLKRAVYPNMGYCHQGWLSADKKYLYVDDEFDESNLTVPTRTLVFNVEDPATTFFVTSFTSGVACIDHNQYVHEGFTFQANYRSGLRIFDTATNPENPTQVGWFDTYPENDDRGYQGAWSNYPFSPNGSVFISDINRGFFLVNVLDATTRSLFPSAHTVSAGSHFSGALGDVTASDDQHLRILNNPNVFITPVQAEFTTIAVDNQPRRIRVSVEAGMNTRKRYDQVCELYDWVAGAWVPVDSRLSTFTDQSFTSDWVSDPVRFVNQSTKEVKLRLTWKPNAAEEPKFVVALDQIKFEITQ